MSPLSDWIWWAILYILIGLVFVDKGKDAPIHPVVELLLWPLAAVCIIYHYIAGLGSKRP